LIFKSTQPAPSTCPSLETYFKSTVLRHILSALWAIGMTIYLYAYQHLKFAGQLASQPAAHNCCIHLMPAEIVCGAVHTVGALGPNSNHRHANAIAIAIAIASPKAPEPHGTAFPQPGPPIFPVPCAPSLWCLPTANEQFCRFFFVRCCWDFSAPLIAVPATLLRCRCCYCWQQQRRRRRHHHRFSF